MNEHKEGDEDTTVPGAAQTSGERPLEMQPIVNESQRPSEGAGAQQERIADANPAVRMQEVSRRAFALPTVRLTIEEVAKLCHNVNRAYTQAIGDHSVDSWEGVSGEMRALVINGVEHRLVHPFQHPRDSHANWLAEKERLGWKYGPRKDEVKKEHPCMVPFDELPQEHRVKDYLFVTVIEALRGAGMIVGHEEHAGGL